MKIAIASLGDPSSASTWSGIPCSIMAELEKRGHEVIPIALSKPAEPWHFSWRRRFHHRVRNNWFLGAVEKVWLSKVSEQLDDHVKNIRPRIVLVIHADWLAYATFRCPAVIIHDTTFASIVDYYPSFSNLSRRSLKNGHEMYRRALEKCAAAVYPADWATRSAVAQYNLPETKAFTIPFGANMRFDPGGLQVAHWIDQRSSDETCKLVFIGTQWNRKGGPEVLGFVRALNAAGVKTTLTIVGCTPPIPADLAAFVDQVGFLYKDDPAHAERFSEILRKSHALIVLSHAECYGCVYCEANAYGLPAIGRDTGGVAGIIRSGVNGLLLGADERVEILAEKWSAIWRNRIAYTRLARNAYEEYAERLNYGVFVRKLEAVMTDVISGNIKESAE